MKNLTKRTPMTTAALTAMPALSTYPLDTIAFSNETASKVAEARKGKIPLAVPEEAETNPVSAPRQERTSFSLNSTMESVGEVEAAADRLAEASGLDEDERFRIGMAVREAAVNAVLHGNEYDPAKKITVSLENTGADLVISVADEGKGLDPDTLPDPLAPENLLRGTGRGIFLIRSFMDEVHFRQLNPGTELTLIKHLNAAGEKSSA